LEPDSQTVCLDSHGGHHSRQGQTL